MREEHVRLFRCVRCGNFDLNLNAKDRQENEIITGTIFCKCGAGYPIVKGIPRFIERWQSLTDTQSKFEFQWETWGKEDVIFGRTKEQSKEYLLKTAGFNLREDFFKGKTVLDAGCGHGRFVELFAEMGASLSVGIDLGDGIEKAQWRNRNLANTLFVQGNILNIPFRPELFDYIWCNGVIHHTPNAKLGAKPMSMCKKRRLY
jgi:2-polyprenyl-3-methyl-5-hydroxy-6-metoxy-1,4-benzoquinol methylase